MSGWNNTCKNFGITKEEQIYNGALYGGGLCYFVKKFLVFVKKTLENVNYKYQGKGGGLTWKLQKRIL